MNKRILGLALPNIVTNITVPLLGMVDTAIMGHLSAAHLGAITIGTQIFNLIYWNFGFLRMGTSGLTAQAYGARRWQETRALLRQGLTVALSFGLAIVVLQVPLRWLTFWMLQAEGEVAALCTPYYHICVWGAPAVLGLYVLMGWLVGMQNTRLPMMIAIGQNVVNIALSLVLVIGFDMGIRGVALGTVVAQWAGFLAGIFRVQRMVLREKGTLFTLHSSLFTFHSSLNLDIFLRTLCLVSVNLYFTSAGAAQGALILAANTLLMQFFMFYSYIMDGFANAGEALSGRYVGAADQPMLQQTVRRLFGWGCAVAMLFTVAYALVGTPLLRLMTSDASVVATARVFLPWAVLIPVAGMAAFVWDGIFIGTTLSRGMLVSCFWAAAAFFGLWFALSPLTGNHALWIALLTYLAMRGLLQTMIWKRNVRQ